MIYGVDISAYQPVFDFAAARREGYDFAIIKSTEGTGWKSGYYKTHVTQARAAGLLVAAYHYVRGSDVNGQLANIRSMVDTATPVIPDVEDGAGDIGSIRRLIDALRAAGYMVPLVYIPQWYWRDHMGRPDLKGLPPNWHSRYPDNNVRRKDGFTLGSEYWPSFGGLNTEIAQFTSSLAVANYPNGRIDGNAYRGTRAQLAALLNGDDDLSADDVMNYPLDMVRLDGSTEPANVREVLRHSEHQHAITRSELKTVKAALSEIKALVAELKASGIPVKAEVDVPAIVKAVNDENDRRDRDGDPTTGQAS